MSNSICPFAGHFDFADLYLGHARKGHVDAPCLPVRHRKLRLAVWEAEAFSAAPLTRIFVSL